jgi:hypothetical protein
MEGDLIPHEATEITTFIPTPKMLEWVDTAVELMTDSPSKIQEACRVNRSNWYDWLKIDGFEEWFYETYRKNRKRILPQLDGIGMQFAKRGSFQHWEAMNKKAGEDLDSKGSMGVRTDGKTIEVVFKDFN